MTTPSSIEERIARLEGSFEQIDRRLTTLEQDLREFRSETSARFDRLEERFDGIEQRLGQRLDGIEPRIGQRIDGIEQRIDRLMFWQLGLMGAIAASILATVLTRLL
jgi:chromosome segregation ATPase